jgi:hypothetical protein
MDAFDEMQTAALTTLDRMLDAATDLRATLTQAAQERRKAELVKRSKTALLPLFRTNFAPRSASSATASSCCNGGSKAASTPLNKSYSTACNSSRAT